MTPPDPANLPLPHEATPPHDAPPLSPSPLDPNSSLSIQPTFLSLYDPDGFETALVTQNFSQRELIQRILTLVRDPDPKVSATGISLLNQHSRTILAQRNVSIKVKTASRSRKESPDGTDSSTTISATRILSALEQRRPVIYSTPTGTPLPADSLLPGPVSAGSNPPDHLAGAPPSGTPEGGHPPSFPAA